MSKSRLTSSNNPHGKEWYFPGVSRIEIQRLLKNSANQPGVFLIRESKTQKGCYALSKVECVVDKQRIIKHYIIDVDKNGHYCIPGINKRSFPTLDELIMHYSSNTEFSQ